MICESFKLAWRALYRSRVLWLMLGAVGLIHLAMPALVRTDGTADGWREMTVRAVCGGAYAALALATLVMACGAVAAERESRRLALSCVRPASLFGNMAGRWLAFVAVALPALALNCALTMYAVRGAPDCRHRYRPQLPSASRVAAAMLDDYLKDPSTPEAVRKARRGAVLELLANKEKDRYEAVRPGGAAEWSFAVAESGEEKEFGAATLRVRFATQMDLRSTLAGRFAFGGATVTATNSTQSVTDVDFRGALKAGADARARFENLGRGAVMFRPRRDVELLLPADGFAMNLLRAGIQMLAVTGFLAAFGIMLSAALSRPVAVFTALVAALVALMAPDVTEVFPDALDISPADRLGMYMTRAVSSAVNWAFASSPVADLATGVCVEWRAVLRDAAVGLAGAPLALLAAAAFAARRKALPAQS